MALEHPVDTPPAELLRSAREAAWSDDESAAPDAYVCAIRAIEQAFGQIATPENPTTDLGMILAHYEDRPDLWCESYPRVPVLESTMEALGALWRSRPKPDDLFPVLLADARVAVTVAESVVSLAEQGFIGLLDELTPEEEAEDLRTVEEHLERKRLGVEEESRPFEEYVAERAAREHGE